MSSQDLEQIFQNNNFREGLEEVTFYQGRLKVFQPKKGFRFGIDSILLASFIELKPRERVLEIGAGTGIISFTLMLRYPASSFFLLELEPLNILALKLGIEKNSFDRKIFLIRGDALRAPLKANFFDVLFANPPYFREKSGRISPFFQKNLAKRETTLELDGLLRASAKLLKNRGSLYLIFTAYRLAELLSKAKQNSLEPKVLRLVHSYPGDEAKLVLLKAIKGAREDLRILPPLYIYEGKKKDYTEEVKKILTLSYI